ncbi:nucleoside-diphosphate sugar epimerase/dehydratase [Rubrivirga sp. S365]|uniref:Nucleoside-diphosphate sugar epimerase/dehydratase n=1 Tax=Rubrivirga litoralis TaxID=3075598 RepID=A0ABU3BRC4_9BACT|nr:MULTISPECIES: nucleoside-diphosphate sugar epimerase/dehydratase [unclassified Rubrivirga]MDT0631805.1 nucleoside-diphosphate sugar epimerase/dehydratase [Rubrivirga sp. F394]MDT7856503.1 nucleoside-diphosphate sugar epimerase/dehydratase [Rubrivirga sp. S365]
MTRLVLKSSLDYGVWLLAAPLAFVLRLDAGAFAFGADVLTYTAVGGLLKAVVLIGMNRRVRSWHRVGLRDMVPLLVAVVAVALVEFVAAAASVGDVFVPRSVPLIEAMLAILGLAGLRFAARLYYEERGILQSRRRGERGRRVIVAGAGDAGVAVVREMLRHPKAGRWPVGFVDDDPSKLRKRVAGLPVLGEIDELAVVADRVDADEVLIAMPSHDGGVVRRVVERASKAGLQHRTVPGLLDLVSGRVSVSNIRRVDVEDLLGRKSVRLETGPIEALVSGRTVLVTGAGGSIGSEVVRQIAPFAPGEIVLLGRGENSVFRIDGELARSHPALARRPVICDVRDERSLRAVFEAHRPEVVFHAAAHKHVPLMEANPEQAVWNNVGGTLALARLAVEFGVDTLVNVSTDKAVNPTNVMGASKRVAEMVVADAARRCAGCTMVSVRFGNVLGSRGSVVPLFRDQIRRGGPVTVTHPDMVRYFMTIPEAAGLVLQAGAVAESGRVYVLDMGEPVRIADLARDLILLSGLEPGRDIDIEYTGARPGEKLYEELLLSEEGTEPSPHEKIFVARKSRPAGDITPLLDALFEAARSGDGDAVRQAFRGLVPTYRPEAAAPTGSGASAGGHSGDGQVGRGVPVVRAL